MNTSSRSPTPGAVVRTALLAGLLGAATCTAWAEEEADDVPMYEGTWSLHLQGHHAAKLVVQDWAGTWQETGPGARDSSAKCRGRKYPITVQHSNPTEFEFTVWGSAVSPSCPDITVSVKPIDAKTLAGTTGSGDEITMTRASRK